MKFNKLLSSDWIEIKPIRIKKTNKGITFVIEHYHKGLEYGLKNGKDEKDNKERDKKVRTKRKK